MTETADKIAEQSRLRLLHRIDELMSDNESVELEQPTYVPRNEDTWTSSHLHRVERSPDGEKRFHLTADNDGNHFYWTYEDMSFDELYNVCIELETQMRPYTTTSAPQATK